MKKNGNRTVLEWLQKREQNFHPSSHQVFINDIEADEAALNKPLAPLDDVRVEKRPTTCAPRR